MKKVITNWSNYPRQEVEWFSPSRYSEVQNILSANTDIIARGAGRCYGDSSLAPNVIDMLGFNKFLSFDTTSGVLNCQAGVTLDEILKVIVPKGWFLPVTPGTKFITVGGAVASDVHGKNHHKEGSFCDHVHSMEIMFPDGTITTCSPTHNASLFELTRGGMGLTGIILTVAFRLKKIESSYIKQIQIKAKNLDEIFDLFEANKHYTYSMSWIDCFQQGNNLGRSILIAGEHATLEELNESQREKPLKVFDKQKLTIPFYFPTFVLNPLTIRGFNFLYYLKNVKKEQRGVISYDPFFYPLDAIHHWNRMYGKPGFLQYQFVLPLPESKKGLTIILDKIRKKNMGSFLAVLKLFGKQNDLISFPMEGYTLALDFPVKKQLFPFLDEMDKVVTDLGGRLYLTKDARMNRNTFLKGYGQADKFTEELSKIDAGGKLSSFQSKRLINS